MDSLETDLKDLRDIRSTGAGVAETSFYPAISNLLNEIGRLLKPISVEDLQRGSVESGARSQFCSPCLVAVFRLD